MDVEFAGHCVSVRPASLQRRTASDLNSLLKTRRCLVMTPYVPFDGAKRAAGKPGHAHTPARDRSGRAIHIKTFAVVRAPQRSGTAFARYALARYR